MSPDTSSLSVRKLPRRRYNDAKISVAQADREGAIGAANAERDQRISVSLANSEAIKGENEAKVQIAESDSVRREREAEALKSATAAEKIQAAKALEEAYSAAESRLSRRVPAREQATQRGRCHRQG